jgi:thiol reductant ABC exporter CydC subunit
MRRTPAGSHRDGTGAPTRKLVALVRPAARPLFLACLLGAGAIGAGIGLLATAAWLISRAAQHPGESALALGIVAVQFFGLSRGLLRYGQRLVAHDAAFRALADLRVRMYARLEALAPAGLPMLRSGELLARFVHDVESLQDLLVRVVAPFAIALLVGAVTVAVQWTILPAAGVILLVALLLAATVVPWLTSRLAQRGEAHQAAARAELTAAVVDLVRGGPELAVYGVADRSLAAMAAIDGRLRAIARRAALTAGAGQGLATLLPGLAMVGSLVVGVEAVQAGRLDIVLLAVIAVVPLAAFELATPLPAATQTLAGVRSSLGRTLDVVEQEPLVADPAAPEPLPAGRTIRIQGLRCRYADDGPWVLDGVELDLVPGRRVAIVGRSGAGKSTLADVLLRFLPYQEGSVTLGGVELCALRGDDCRRVVGAVSQDAHVFNASVAANLRVARRDATDEQLRDALARARLLEWVDQLPRGLRTELGEFGSRMSGGQRHRLAAARAFLADFPVLVLDEPGQHLDAATADALVADLLAGAHSQTIVLITHRLACLDRVDDVIVLDRGRVLERGRHVELFERGGLYAEMWRREAAQR